MKHAMGIIALVIGLVAVAIVVLVVLYDTFASWDYDKRNPARRWCRECGQTENFFEPGGWEPVHPSPLQPCERCCRKTWSDK